MGCAGLWRYMVICGVYHTMFTWYGHKNLHGQHCTYSGGIWSTLFYTVLTVAMSDLALWLLRNPETARFFDCLILQANGSLGLPRNKRTVVPLFTFLFKVVDSQRGIWILDGESCVWKVLGSTRAKVLWTGQLSQADPSMVKVQVRSHYQCVGGGGGVCGRETQEVRWMGQGGTYQSSAKYRTATILPANKNKWQMLDQEVYGFGTRLSFLQLFLGSAPVLQLK